LEHTNPEKALEYAKDAIISADKLSFEKGIAEGYINSGKAHRRLSNFNKAIDSYQKALKVNEEIAFRKGIANSYNGLGITSAMLGDYDSSLEYFLKSLKIQEVIGDTLGISHSLNNIGIVYGYLGNHKKSLEYYLNALSIRRAIGNKGDIAGSLNNIGDTYSALGDNKKALKYLLEALGIQEEIGNNDIIFALRINIGNVYANLNDHKKAVEYYQTGLNIAKEMGDKWGMAKASNSIGISYLTTNNYPGAEQYFKQALELAVNIEAKDLIKECYEYLSDLYSSKNNYEKSLEYYKLYTEVKDSIFNETSNERLAEIQTRFETEKKEAEIEILKSEKTIQELELGQLKDLGIYLTVILLLAIIIAFISYNRYRLKKKANILLEEKNRLEVENREKVLSMFGQQVSKEIVDELMAETSEKTKTLDKLLSETKQITSKRRYVCIMFLDIRDFTSLVEKKEPEDIIAYQNLVFGFMIEIINKHHGVILQFLGDGYMATFGAPASHGNDCQNAVNAALEIIKKVNEKTKSGVIPPTKIGIGLHAGNVVTGNVGTSLRKQYSITGNTVILASRIEQLNKKFNSQFLISEEVLHNIKNDGLNLESLGPVDVKGRENPIHLYKLY
jgi:class 3 adenylate cyclase